MIDRRKFLQGVLASVPVVSSVTPSFACGGWHAGGGCVAIDNLTGDILTPFISPLNSYDTMYHINVDMEYFRNEVFKTAIPRFLR